MRLLIFLSLLVLGQGFSPRRPNECNTGPAYYCDNIKNAEDCGTVDVCLTMVWKYATPAPDNSAECSGCKVMLNILKNTLVKGRAGDVTSQRMEDALSGVCNFMLDGDIKYLCKNIVEDKLETLSKMLDANIHFDTICATLGVCSGAAKMPENALPLVQKSTDDICNDCMKFFQDVQQMVDSKETLDELEQLLNQTICSQLGSFQGICGNLLKQYLPEALQYLAAQVQPDFICRVFGFCGANGQLPQLPTFLHLKNVFKNKVPLDYKSSDECAICKDITQQVNDMLRDNTTQSKFKEFVESNLCDVLGGLKAECTLLLSQYTPMLFEFLANELDPNTFCESIGLCAVPQPAVVTMTLSESSQIECEFCQVFMQKVEKVLSQDDTIETVDDLLKKVCGRLATTELNDQCTQYIRDYGEEVIKMLLSEMNPKLICGKLPLCPEDVDVVPGIETVQDHLSYGALGADDYGMMFMDSLAPADVDMCQVCTVFVSEVKKFIQNISGEKFAEGLGMACNYLPAEHADMCRSTVSKHVPSMVTLVQNSDTQSLCGLTQICQPNQLQLTPQGASQSCELCETVFSAVKEHIPKNISKAEVKALVEKVCKLMPDSQAQKCELFGDMAVELIMDAADAHAICLVLGMCKTEDVQETVQVVAVDAIVDATVPSEACELCDTIIFFAKEMITQNATEEEILAALEGVCDRLPTVVQGPCKLFITKYGNDIVKFLVEKVDAHEICMKLEICKEALSQEAAAPSETCEICDTIAMFIKNYVGQNATQEIIISALDEVCSKLPTEVSTVCEAVVSNYGEELVQYLLADLDPHTICIKIGLCKETTAPVKAKTENKEVCHLCEDVMSKLDIMLDGDVTYKGVVRAFYNVCSSLPGHEAVTCKAFINEFGKKIISIIQLEVIDYELVCFAMKLCSKSAMDTLPALPMVKIQPAVEIAAPSETCTICITAITFVKQYLAQNATEAEIMAAVEGMCEQVPDVAVSACKELVKKYGKMIVDLLLSDMDAHAICLKIGLCKEQITVETVTASGECDICTTVIQFAKDFIGENTTEEEILAGLDAICARLPTSLSGTCKQLVDEYGKMIVQLLLQDLDAHAICTQLGLCQQALAVKPSAPTGACEVCTTVVTFASEYIGQNATEEEIIAAVEALCNQLPGDLRQSCTAFIDEYGNLLIQILVHELDPNVICTQMGLCQTTKTVEAAAPSTECLYCTTVITFVKQYISQNATEAEILADIKAACDDLPTALSATCSLLVDEYGPMIVQMLIQDLDANAICTEIGLCKAVLAAKAAAPSEACQYCTTVITFVKQYVSQNATEAEILAGFKAACDELPTALSATCSLLVDEYGDLIVKLLLQELDAKAICTEIGLCKAAQTAVKVSASQVCQVCNTIVVFAKEFIGQKATETEILTAIEALCNEVPESLQASCKMIVMEYGPMLVELLVQELDAHTICLKLELCKEALPTLPAVEVKSSHSCELCSMVIYYLKNYISNNDTEAMIIAKVEGVCHHVPKIAQHSCKKLIETYGDRLVQLFLQQLDDAHTICMELGLCKVKQQVKSVESSPQSCELCNTIIFFVKQYIGQNDTEAQMIAKVESICEILPAFGRQPCRTLIEQYGDSIVQLLLEKMDAHVICTELKLCKDEVALKQHKLNIVANPLVCETCTNVLQYMDKRLAETETEQLFEDAFDSFCDELPGQTGSICKVMVSEFTPTIISFIVLEMKPQDACTAIGLCNATKARLLPSPGHQLKLTDESETRYLPVVQDQRVDVSLDSSESADLEKPLGKPSCAFCEYVVTELDRLLQENASSEAVHDALAKICKAFPKKMQSACQTIATEYGKLIIYVLEKETVDPKHACTLVNLCGTDEQQLQLIKHYMSSPNLCLPCEFVVTEVKTYIEKNTTVAEIEAKMKKYCDILPDTVTAQCHDIVDQYVPAVLALLDDNLNPEQVCQELNFCAKTKVEEKNTADDTLYFRPYKQENLRPYGQDMAYNVHVQRRSAKKANGSN